MAPSVQTMVSLRQATVTYPGASLPALDECSFSVPRGQLTVLMGPNGSGKSTALRVLAGLQPLVRGHIRGGAKIRRRRDTPGEPGELRVGYVPQNPVLYFSQRTVRDEVALAATLRGLSADATSAAVDEVLRRLSLTELVDRHPRELSGGEQLRVAVAAVMVRHPDLLLLDEPTRGLDVTAKAELGNWLKQDGRTVVMATHDLDFAAEFADHAVFFHAGHAVLEGPPVQIFRRALTFAPTISRAFRPFHLDVHCLADAMKVGMAR
ncbi:hypothetical protein GCM10025857_14280 [Alicyclobacillus contaminans]|nr:hypothetical protein GCM10025857_14280 [Alicyclobacillus contaminans]